MTTARLNQRFRVYIGLVNTGYTDISIIQNIIKEAISYCGLDTQIARLTEESKHRYLIKPSLVHADTETARYAHTAAEVLQASIDTVLSLDTKAEFEIFTDRHVLGLSSRTMYQASGFYEKLKKYRPKIKFTGASESEAVEFHLIKNEKEILNSTTSYVKNDLRIYCPKIRTDILSSGFAGAVRLGKETIFDPNSEEKIANHLEICNPELVIGDGIYIPIGGSRITQHGQELGIILVSNNAVAHDIVAAQILNLSPDGIRHLKRAIEKGWGPASISEIELGGAAEAGLKALSQKTRSWNVGFHPLNRIKDKYEHENPGLRFPFEIFSDSPNEKTANSHASGLVAETFCTVFDTPQLRAKLARWPRSTIVCGNIKNYPIRKLVYVIGDQAVIEFSKMVSTEELRLNLILFSFVRAKLKNGVLHYLIEIKDRRMSYWTLALVFYLTSFGRMHFPLFKPKEFSKALFTKIVRMIKRKKKGQEQISSKLAQNQWWAL